LWTKLHAKKRMQFRPNNFRSVKFTDICYWVESIYFMKTVAYCIINELVEGNRSQVSWTERHEALLMSFCPKSNSYHKKSIDASGIVRSG
ncbi:MAG: hypothetical protein Q8R24_04110, partial [Legionellaceae bacterium]|nr:hypothetical protein [Legionellaceae bacterium]